MSTFLDETQQLLDSFDLDSGIGTSSSHGTASVDICSSVNTSVDNIIPDTTDVSESTSTAASPQSANPESHWKLWNGSCAMFSGQNQSQQVPDGHQNPVSVSQTSTAASSVSFQVDPAILQWKSKFVMAWMDKLDGFPLDLSDGLAVDRWFLNAFPYFDRNDIMQSDKIQLLLESVKDHTRVYRDLEWELLVNPESTVDQLLRYMWQMYAEPDSIYLFLMHQLLSARQKEGEYLMDYFLRLHDLSVRIRMRFSGWQDIEDKVMKYQASRGLINPVYRIAACDFVNRGGDFKSLGYHLRSLDAKAPVHMKSSSNDLSVLDYSTVSEVASDQSTVSEAITVVDCDQSVCSSSVVDKVDKSVESVDDKSSNGVELFVGNLPRSVTRRKLRDVLRKRGPVVKLWRSSTRNFAFVTFAHPSSARQALKLNGVVIDGCKLKVKWKQPLLKQKCQSCCDSVRRQVDLVERERNLQILTGRYKHLFPVGQSTSAVT